MNFLSSESAFLLVSLVLFIGGRGPGWSVHRRGCRREDAGDAGGRGQYFSEFAVFFSGSFESPVPGMVRGIFGGLPLSKDGPGNFQKQVPDLVFVSILFFGH